MSARSETDEQPQAACIVSAAIRSVHSHFARALLCARVGLSRQLHQTATGLVDGGRDSRSSSGRGSCSGGRS